MQINLNRLTAVLGYSIALTGFIPLFPHLPMLPRLLFITGFAAGLLGDRRSRPLLNGRLLTAGSILLFLWYGAQFSRHNPALPVVNILVILLSARLAAEKSHRNWLQAYAISLFCLSASSLFELGPAFLFFLTIMILMLALSLVLLTFQSRESLISLTQKGLWQLVATGLMIPLVSILLIPLFFPILPRTQFPLWNFIQQAGQRQSGLADNVSPGNSARIPDTGPVVFRVEMGRLEPRLLYWRGSSFSRLSSLDWRKDPPAAYSPQTTKKPLTSQTITMEPNSSRQLVGLDLPVAFTYPNGSSINNAVWNRPLPSSRRMRYEVQSVLTGLSPVREELPIALLTRLPDNTPPRLLQLSKQFADPALTNRQRIERVENWFRQGGFRYSRTDLPTGEQALDSFLFDRKSGHCEFFASSFALLLRGAGVPSRLVGGYLGGEYNEIGGYYRVSEERAHVWVESLIPGEGWIRIDPSSFAINADAALGEKKDRSLILKLRLLMDSLDHTWNSAVITYDFERQLETANRIHGRLTGFSIRSAKGLLAPAAAICIMVAAVWLFVWWRRNRTRFSREARLLHGFRKRLQSDLGISVMDQTGLFDISKQADHPLVTKFAELYAGSVYCDRPISDRDYQQLKEILHKGFRR